MSSKYPNDVELSQNDKEANLFAMYLLMPEDWVRKEVQKMGGIDLCSDDQMKKLARKFAVPQTLMAIRIGQIYTP